MIGLERLIIKDWDMIRWLSEYIYSSRQLSSISYCATVVIISRIIVWYSIHKQQRRTKVENSCNNKSIQLAVEPEFNLRPAAKRPVECVKFPDASTVVLRSSMLHKKVGKHIAWHGEQRPLSGGSKLIEQTLTGWLQNYYVITMTCIKT